MTWSINLFPPTQGAAPPLQRSPQPPQLTPPLGKPINVQQYLLGNVDSSQLSDADLDQWTDKLAANLIRAYRSRQQKSPPRSGGGGHARHAPPEIQVNLYNVYLYEQLQNILILASSFSHSACTYIYFVYTGCPKKTTRTLIVPSISGAHKCVMQILSTYPERCGN